MRVFLEQRYNIKFLFKLGKNFTETFQMLKQVYKDLCFSRTQCYEWFTRFKNGQESVEDDDHGQRPTTSTDENHVDQIREKIRANGRLTVRELSDEVGVSFGSVQSILTDILEMHRVAAKWVPRLLTQDQKANRVLISQELLERSNADASFLNKIVTGDESWVYGYDAETKAQSSQWVERSAPRPKKIRQIRTKTKVLLTVFFDARGVIHHEFLPPNQTVNRHYYNDVLRRLRENVRRKRPELWAENSWFLQHDNAPAHSALQIREFCASTSMSVLPHPPYSPDLAPSDFFLFPKLKRPLKGQRFDTVEKIKETALKELRAIPSEDFTECFTRLKLRWEKCMKYGGEYFEGAP